MPDVQIQLTALEKRFGEVHAVAPLTLSIAKGEFVVLLGPSGCGKTTTLRMIAGLETPTSGTITVGGRDVTRLRPGDRNIAFVFQMFALYPHLTAYDNIAFPLRAAGFSRADVTRRVEQTMARLGITHLAAKKPRTLSGGDQQRVSLARAMVREPAAFLMDEPLGTLDADQREHTRAQLRALHNELQATTVFVTHDQLEAMSLADRIAIMHDGKLQQFAPPREVYRRPANLFVAHFIGSPGMNFLPMKRAEGGYQLKGTTLKMQPPVVAEAETLTLGIRPEDIRLDPAGARAVVEHSERLGPYNLLAIRLGRHPAKVRVPGNVVFAEGEQVAVSLSPEGCRWFDPISGNAIATEDAQ
jgi:multiple sugar transport system ATP-binding protein